MSPYTNIRDGYKQVLINPKLQTGLQLQTIGKSNIYPVA